MATPPSITVATTPDIASSWSGSVSIQITVHDDPDLDANQYELVIDGWRVDYNVSADESHTFSYDTSGLPNGLHELYTVVRNAVTHEVIYGTNTASFTTSNNGSPWQIRANFNELWLTPNDTVTLTSRLVAHDKQITNVTMSFTSSDPTIATVDNLGHVTAVALGDTTIVQTYSSFTNTIYVHVNPQNVTPHFGKNGAQLLSYDPLNSMFVRSMFFLDPAQVNTEPALATSLHAAQINTLETGLYQSTIGLTDPVPWQQAMESRSSSDAAILNANHFSVLLTGDEVARQGVNLYESSRGLTSIWNPNPITFAFNLAKTVYKAIGVEMVDEISSAYSGPFPHGHLGQSQGPQQINCAAGTCHVVWSVPITNGAGVFLITGGTTHSTLNTTIAQPYSILALTLNGFDFVNVAVGTATVNATTDPNLVLEMLAASAFGDGTDYNHDDAFTQVMAHINSVTGRPSITWPAAAAAPPPYWGFWAGDPAVSDYASIYWTFFSPSYADRASIADNVYAWNYAWPLRYPEVQKLRPVLFEAAVSGPEYRIHGMPVTVSAITNETITFAAPHGITDLVNARPRFSVTGNSTSGANTKYVIYEVVNATTVKAYKYLPTGGPLLLPSAGTATFANGHTYSLYAMHVVNENSADILFLDACPLISDGNQTMTVSGSSYAPYNAKWWMGPIFGSVPTACGAPIHELFSGSGTGGTALVVADSRYHGGLSTLTLPGQSAEGAAANIVFAAAKGAAGVRYYNYEPDLNTVLYFNGLFDSEPIGEGIQPGVNPLHNNSDDNQSRWQALSNANNLISSIEPYLLQPKLHSPDYGTQLVTTARTSPYGTLLLMINGAGTTVTETVDLSSYKTTGVLGRRYRMTATSMENVPAALTSESISFAPGETVAWTFPRSGPHRLRLKKAP